MNIYVAVWVIVIFSLSLLRLFVSALRNYYTIRGDRQAPLGLVAARQTSVTTWLLIPALGYILSVVTNVGVAVALDEYKVGRLDSGNGLNILYAGFLGLEAAAMVALYRAKANTWHLVDNWPLLWLEVSARVDERQEASKAWLREARLQYHLLATRNGALERRATRADALFLTSKPAWARRPAFGCGSARDAEGQRIPVSFAQIMRWCLKNPPEAMVTISLFSFLVLSICLLAWQRDTPLTSAYPLSLLLVLAILLVTARIDLTYYARVFDEGRDYRARVDSLLMELETSISATTAADDARLKRLLRFVFKL